MYDETIQDVVPGTDFDFSADMVDLSELDDSSSGIPSGWYASEVIEGFAGRKGEITTGTSVSGKGDSFNLRICFRITVKDEAKTLFTSINYRAIDFSKDRVTAVQNLRAEFAGRQGKWEGHEDAQRSSLALSKLGQLQNATGANLPMIPGSGGKINAVALVGTKPFIYIGYSEKSGYDEVKRFSKFPNGRPPQQRGTRGKKGA